MASPTLVPGYAGTLPPGHTKEKVDLWQKDQLDRNPEKLQKDLWALREDLSEWPNVPAQATQHCEKIEQELDKIAHRGVADCPACHTRHALKRIPRAKDEVASLVAQLEKDTSEFQQGLAKGKMLGVLVGLQKDGDSYKVVTLKGFSGNVNDEGDWNGWVPPVPRNKGEPVFKNAKGAVVAVPAQLPKENFIGVCAAPKLIQEAYRLGITPIGLAEMYFEPGDSNRHGKLRASCTTCQDNIGIQTCELDEKQQEFLNDLQKRQKAAEELLCETTFEKAARELDRGTGHRGAEIYQEKLDSYRAANKKSPNSTTLRSLKSLADSEASKEQKSKRAAAELAHDQCKQQALVKAQAKRAEAAALFT